LEYSDHLATGHFLAHGFVRLLVSGGTLRSGWVLTDGGVDLLVELLIGLGSVVIKTLGPESESSLVLLSIFLLDTIGPGLDMETINSLFVVLSIIFGSLSLLGLGGSWESPGVMRDVETSITGSLKGAEDSGTSGGSLETNVQEALEWSSLALMLGDVISSAVSLGDTLVHTVHALHLEQSPGEEETSAVGGGVVGETSGETESSELLGIGTAEGHVTHEGGVVDGADDSAVGDSDHKSVLFGAEFIVVHDG